MKIAHWMQWLIALLCVLLAFAEPMEPPQDESA